MEVKARDGVVHKASLLGHMFAEHFAQRLVHDVRHRVVAHDGLTALGVDHGLERVARLDFAFTDVSNVTEDACLELETVAHLQERRAVFEHTGVAHLAAHFGIERGLVENNEHIVAGLSRFDLNAVLVKRKHLGFGRLKRVVAHEFVVVARKEHVGGNLELACGASLVLLLKHAGFKTFGVDRQTALTAHVSREVHRETVGVVQLKGDVAGQHAVLAFGHGFIKDLHTVGERLQEAFFFRADHFGDLRILDFRIDVAHFACKRFDQLIEEQTAGTQLVAVTDRAAADAADHISAAFVAGLDAVGNGKAAGTDVVGNDLQ